MQLRGLNPKFMKTIGFRNFTMFMEKKIEQMFVKAMGPVLSHMRNLRETTGKRKLALENEAEETDPVKMLSTTRDCGSSFATALTHVMEGVLRLKEGRMTLETELREFHAHHQGSTHFSMLPSDDFTNLNDYIDYLKNEVQVGAFDVEVNGGAQFRRLMMEVEIFLRFSEVNTETKKRDVLQARGVSMSSLSWRGVVEKLLSNEAHLPLQRRVQYVGERIRWFFEKQKEAVIEFMDGLEGTPCANLYSPLYPKHAKILKQNDVIRNLVLQTHDMACQRQLKQFVELFDNMLTSTFSNPWVFLKGVPMEDKNPEGAEVADADMEEPVLPSFEDTKERIPKEIQERSSLETRLSKWLQEIPTESKDIDNAVDKVQVLVLTTFGSILHRFATKLNFLQSHFSSFP